MGTNYRGNSVPIPPVPSGTNSPTATSPATTAPKAPKYPQSVFDRAEALLDNGKTMGEAWKIVKDEYANASK